MYTIQNNSTSQVVEEVKTEAVNVCTQSYGSGRIRYHFYSDGSVYEEIRMLSGERTKHKMTLEEINNSSILITRMRDRVLKAGEKFKQTGNVKDLYNF